MDDLDRFSFLNAKQHVSWHRAMIPLKTERLTKHWKPFLKTTRDNGSPPKVDIWDKEESKTNYKAEFAKMQHPKHTFKSLMRQIKANNFIL